jgi:enhancing lycopene biosynthesis protein 2
MTHKKLFAVVLSGCGVYDGAEIHESVLTLLALEKANVDYRIYAPDIEQHHVINHLSGEVTPERRNVLVEAARIARGKISPLEKLKPYAYDAVIFPGGYGVAKNLSSLAFDGAHCKIDPTVEKIIKGFHDLKKPIGAICISPALIARVLGKIEVTIGDDKETVTQVIKMGGQHHITTNGQIFIDPENKIVSAPCYMLETSVLHVAIEVENVVNALLKLCTQTNKA